MKQKKFGKKIQNWHRPLGPSQLRRRFRTHRYDDSELDARRSVLDEFPEGDDCWDCYDPPCDPDCEYCGGDDGNDLYGYYLRRFVQGLAYQSPPLIPLELAVDRAAAEADNADLSLPEDRQNPAGIEQRLASHIDRLSSISSDSTALRQQISESIRELRNIEIVQRVADKSRVPDLATRACLFAPFWVRPPLTWDIRSGRLLVDHLFAHYEIPPFLYAEWFRRSDITRFKWVCWFILLGQGGSLKRAADFFHWNIPARFTHHLFGVPYEASPTEACLMAEVKRLGGSDVDCDRILRNPAFVIDPTEPSADESHREFWHDTVSWLIAHREAITDEECSLILSWAMHEYTEAHRADSPPFSWKGRRVRAVLARSVEYQREVENPWYRYRWRRHGWNWRLDDPPHGTWSFIELTSGDDLFEEGRELRHCVASYAGRCVSGYSAIVSIRYNDVRRITIEISPRTRRVVQARGLCNRQANAEELRVLSLWMTNVVRRDTSAQTQ